MPRFFFSVRKIRYSLNLQETVRSKDKEPYDNIIGNARSFGTND